MKQKENTGSKTNDFIAHTSYEQRGRFNQSLIGDVDTAFPTQLRMHLSRQEHKRWRRSAKGNVPPWRKAGVGRTLGAVAVEARAGQCPGHVSCPLNIKSSGGSPALLSLSGLPLCPFSLSCPGELGKQWAPRARMHTLPCPVAPSHPTGP